MSNIAGDNTRYRWNRYTGKWTNAAGEEKLVSEKPIRSSLFLKRWLRCARDGESLQYFLREYPWLTRGACQKRMRRMRAKLMEEQGIELPVLLWERAPSQVPRAETTSEWARIYEQEMHEDDHQDPLPPVEPPRITGEESRRSIPAMNLTPEDCMPVPGKVRTAENRNRTVTRDPLLYRPNR